MKGQINPVESAYLLLYFFSYSAAIGCLAVCGVARLLKGTRKLSRYCWWIVASMAFLIFRNVAFFLKEFRGIGAIEEGLAFYMLYMVTMAGFLGTLAWASLGYAFADRPRIARRAFIVMALIPLAFIPALALYERGIHDFVLRLHLINAVMYFSYFAVVGVIVTLGVRLSKIANTFERSLCKANALSSLSYVVLAFAQWFFVYRGQLYDINQFCIVNVVLFLMFSASAFVVGREALSRKEKPPVPGTIWANGALLSGEIPSYPECNQEESRIINLISRGATNGEIADALGTNVTRVKNVIHRVFSRFGVKSRTELICLIGRSASPTQESDLAERSVVDTNPRVPPGF